MINNLVINWLLMVNNIIESSFILHYTKKLLIPSCKDNHIFYCFNKKGNFFLLFQQLY